MDAGLEAMELARRLSDEELRVVIEVLGLEYHARIKRAAQVAAMNLKVGDDVVMVKAGRIGVHFDEHGFWSVDATLVRKVEAAGEPSG